MIRTTAVFMFSLAFSAFSQAGNDSVTLKNGSDSLSYILGRDIGAQLEQIEAEVNIDAFSAGVEQAMKGQPSEIDSAAADSIRQAFAQRMQEQLQQKQQQEAEQNQKESQSFLNNNKKQKGVKTTSSGLQYKVLQKGNGVKPKSSDTVQVYYKGMLQGGQVIDSTVSGTPASIALQSAIPGVAEGLQLMNEGAKYMFYLPPELAYGSQGLPPQIPPNSVLIFEMELVSVGPGAVSSR